MKLLYLVLVLLAIFVFDPKGFAFSFQNQTDKNYTSMSFEDERDFLSIIKKYVYQDLSESALVASGLVMMYYEERPLEFWYKTSSEKILLPFTDSSKKALLMSIMRLDAGGGMNEDFMEKVFPLKNGFEFFGKFREKNLSKIHPAFAQIAARWIGKIDWGKEFVAFENSGFLLTNFDMEISFPWWPLFANGQGDHRSKEFFDVLKKIVPKDKRDASDEPFPDTEENMDYAKYVVANTCSISFEQLSRQFDYMKAVWNETSEVEFPSISPDSMTLCGERFRALVIAVLRLKVSTLNVGFKSLLYKQEPEFVSGNKEFIAHFDMPNSGELKIAVRPSMENCVFIKSDGDCSSVFPSDGGYYSPELYKIILSISSDILCRNIMLNKTNEE